MGPHEIQTGGRQVPDIQISAPHLVISHLRSQPAPATGIISLFEVFFKSARGLFAARLTAVHAFPAITARERAQASELYSSSRTRVRLQHACRAGASKCIVLNLKASGMTTLHSESFDVIGAGPVCACGNRVCGLA